MISFHTSSKTRRILVTVNVNRGHRNKMARTKKCTAIHNIDAVSASYMFKTPVNLSSSHQESSSNSAPISTSEQRSVIQCFSVLQVYVISASYMVNPLRPIILTSIKLFELRFQLKDLGTEGNYSIPFCSLAIKNVCFTLLKSCIILL